VLLGRASLIIFILALTIFVSAISLGIKILMFSNFIRPYNQQFFGLNMLLVSQSYRWCGYRKHGRDTGEERTYGIRESLLPLLVALLLKWHAVFCTIVGRSPFLFIHQLIDVRGKILMNFVSFMKTCVFFLETAAECRKISFPVKQRLEDLSVQS